LLLSELVRPLLPPRCVLTGQLTKSISFSTKAS
jgi:hypothetical protein